MNKDLMRKLARLAVRSGVNVQKDQPVVVRSTTEAKELTRLIVEEAYLAGAKQVSVEWSDDFTSRFNYIYQTEETLTDVPAWFVDKYHDFVDKNACFISVSSPIPGLNKDVDPTKIQKANMATSMKLDFYRTHMMGNKVQWTIIAAPNPYWAKQVFPEMEENEAVEKLWKLIFDASRVYVETDPVEEWDKHNKTFLKRNEIMNNHQFESLHFTNGLGTDLSVGLVKDHIWAGGGEYSAAGVYYNPNIPTEEIFTMPHKFNTSGKVVATKPLNYQGKLIEGFWLRFENGKVVDFGAEKEVDSLKSLIEFDEGSSYLGEVALISDDSPISNLDVLFLNTLFDENASCHLALGMAYPMTVKNGNDMSKEELAKIGYNFSRTHVDFMFGSPDMKIIGVTHEGKEVPVFENGNFVF